MQSYHPIYYSGISSSNLLHHNNSLIYSTGNNIIIDAQQPKTLKAHDNKVTVITINQSGLMASGQLSSPGNKNYDSPVILWDIGVGKAVAHLEGLKQGVKNLYFSEDGKFIAGVSFKEQFIIWNAKTLQQIYAKVFQFPINLLNFKQTYLTFLNSKIIQQVDLVPLFTSNKPPTYTNFTLPATGLPRNYLCLAQLAERQYLLGTQSGQICLFSKGVFKWGQLAGKTKVSSIVINPYSKQIFAATGNEVIKYSLGNNKFSEKDRKPIPNVMRLCFSQNQQLYAITHGEILIIDQKNLSTQCLRLSHSSRINGVASRDGIVASIEENGTILVRNGEGNVKGKWFPHKPVHGTSIEISYDHTILAGFLDGFMRGISLDGSKVLWQKNAHKGKVSCIKSTQYYVVSGGQDCVVRIWAPKNNQLINQLSVHQRTVTSVLGDCSNPQYLHSCSIDKSIHTYDMKTDKKVNFRQGNTGSITSMDQVKSTGDLVTCGPGLGVCFWKQNDPQPYLKLQAEMKIMVVAVSGSKIALGCDNGTIAIYSYEKKGYLCDFQGHSREITGLSWVSANVLVSVSEDNSIGFWRIQ